ncbi:MAG: hypothetical protein OXF98_12065 [Rhodospirillaceae bacterium]|nr:hypothetical protein [Rhodospirillaceae bacterium]
MELIDRAHVDVNVLDFKACDQQSDLCWPIDLLLCASDRACHSHKVSEQIIFQIYPVVYFGPWNDEHMSWT